MNAQTYMHMMALGMDAGKIGDLVAALPREERIALRQSLPVGYRKLVRTLYFDYQTQEWF